MAISSWLRDRILDKVFLGEDFPSHAGIYVSVHSSDLGTTGAGEIAGTVRQLVAMAPAEDGQSANSATIEFVMPAATATHVGWWDAAEGGQFLWGGPLAEEKSFDEGDILRIPAGELTASLN